MEGRVRIECAHGGNVPNGTLAIRVDVPKFGLTANAAAVVGLFTAHANAVAVNDVPVSGEDALQRLQLSFNEDDPFINWLVELVRALQGDIELSAAAFAGLCDLLFMETVQVFGDAAYELIAVFYRLTPSYRRYKEEFPTVGADAVKSFKLERKSEDLQVKAADFGGKVVGKRGQNVEELSRFFRGFGIYHVGVY